MKQLLKKPTVAIIGGGPSGMSCGLWLKQLGLNPLLLESQSQLGGLQVTSHFHNIWLLGNPGKKGYEVAQEFRQHIHAESLPTHLNCEIQALSYQDQRWVLGTNHGELLAQAIVLATGQRVRDLSDLAIISGSQGLKTSGLVCCDPGVSMFHPPKLTGRTVGVIGGGDNGMVTATLLAATAHQVHLFARSGLRGFGVIQRDLMEWVTSGKVIVHTGLDIIGFEQQGETLHVDARNPDQTVEGFDLDFLCIRIGFAPNTRIVNQLFTKSGVGELPLNSEGYVLTDDSQRTTLPSVYAIGDVANPKDPCVATAVGMGAIAARAIEADLLA